MEKPRPKCQDRSPDQGVVVEGVADLRKLGGLSLIIRSMLEWELQTRLSG